jgi:hypothetical protein
MGRLSRVPSTPHRPDRRSPAPHRPAPHDQAHPGGGPARGPAVPGCRTRGGPGADPPVELLGEATSRNLVRADRGTAAHRPGVGLLAMPY